jgi:hypothetical protein
MLNILMLWGVSTAREQYACFCTSPVEIQFDWFHGGTCLVMKYLVKLVPNSYLVTLVNLLE